MRLSAHAYLRIASARILFPLLVPIYRACVSRAPVEEGVRLWIIAGEPASLQQRIGAALTLIARHDPCTHARLRSFLCIQVDRPRGLVAGSYMPAVRSGSIGADLVEQLSVEGLARALVDIVIQSRIPGIIYADRDVALRERVARFRRRAVARFSARLPDTKPSVAGVRSPRA